MELGSIGKIDRRIRTARRYQEFFTVLARHGFHSFMADSGLGQWLRQEFKVDTSTNGSAVSESLSKEARLRRVIEDLGPTFIKVGQILSTRPDLIPLAFAEELKQLQSDVSPVPFSLIRQVIESEFPNRMNVIFSEINPEPLAAASLAQVHEAILADGTQVVIKVLKPGVEEAIEADIRVFDSIAEFLEKNFPQSGFRPREVAREFARQLRREMDLLQELRSTRRLSAAFEENHAVSFPHVYADASTKRCLTLEKIEGTLLSRVAVESLPIESRHELIKNGADAVFRQCFELGFFHADPHPGNIFILPGSEICFIDCGMVGSIDEETAELLARLIHAVVYADLDRVIEISLRLAGGDRSLARDRAVRSQVWEFISRFQDSSFESLEIGKLLNDFFSLLRSNDLHCPSDIVFLIKAITTIEGVAEELDPSFDIVGFATPYLDRFVRDRLGAAAVAGKVQEALQGYGEVLYELPGWIKDFFSRFRSSRFPIKFEHRGLDELTSTLSHLGNSVSTALIASALLIGSSILVLADRVQGGQSAVGTLGIAGFVLAACFIISILIGNYLHRR